MNVSRLRMTPSQLWALALTSTASFMIALDGTVVTTALSTIRHDLGASVATLEWTVNAYVLSFAVLLMTGAALADRFGRRRMFVAGLAIFIASSAGCALARGIGVLIAARAVEGAGAALVMPLALTQLSAAFSAEQRGRALGIFSGMTGLATLSGPFIGGCGVSMAMPAAQKAAVGAVGAQEIGQASRAFNMLRQLGGVFGIAAIVSVFAATGNLGSARGFTDGFGPAMGVAAVLALAGAAAALGMPGRAAAPRPGKGMSSSRPAPPFLSSSGADRSHQPMRKPEPTSHRTANRPEPAINQRR